MTRLLPTKFKLYEILWDDAATSHGWEPRPSSAESQHCLTLGFLVFEDEHYILVASTVSEDHTNARIQIPKRMIESMREVQAVQVVARKRKPKEKGTKDNASGTIQDKLCEEHIPV